MNSARLIVGGGLLILILFFAGLYLFISKDVSKEASEVVRTNAPNFILPDASGNNFSLEDVEGDVVVLHFWASWSPYSKEELVSLTALKKEYRGKISVVALNRDANPIEGQAFLKTLGLGDEVLFVYDKNDEYFKKVNGFAMPETLFLDSDGNILFHQHGPMTYEEMQVQIETILQ